MELASGFMARRWQADPGSLDSLLDLLATHRDRSSKPFLTILHPGHVEDVTAQARARVCARGFAVFHSFERAAGALARAIVYWRRGDGLD
jgi:hypothetical protein